MTRSPAAGGASAARSLRERLPRPSRLSLAARLVLLFAVGTSLLLVALGIGLTLLLRTQLEARDREEIDGKTEAALFALRELGSAERIEASAARIGNITVGHPHLQVGLREGRRWLVRPMEEIVALVDAHGNDNIPHLPRYGRYQLDHDIWWLRRIDFVTADERTFVAYIGVHVSPAQHLMERLLGSLLVAGVLGVMASALIGWFIVRRGLAPLQNIAREAERVTADRLGEPLRLEDAPEELRGLVGSINRMLERLQASFRALEEFSADIAHELRTPLNNLMLQTQVSLSRERTAPEYQEALHSNLQELEQLQRMVSDMLFLARADRGMLAIRREPVDLGAEAANVAEFFEPAVAEHGQRIVVRGAAGIEGDRGMVRRALTNLLSNAVRYAPHGTAIHVEIRAERRGAVTVEVSNPAEPMSPEELSRLFSRFARGSNAAAAHAAKRSADGAGLGLSIVASIMRLHGGDVQAESASGRVCFRLRFPGAQPD